MHSDDEPLDDLETDMSGETIDLTEEQADHLHAQRTVDDGLQERRYQKLIELGATEVQARSNCVDETSFIAMRIFLRGL